MASFIEEQQGKFPEHAEIYAEFGKLHTDRLWFELTERIHTFVSNEENAQDDNFVQLYTQFVCTFADNINQLRLVQICGRAAQQKCPNGTKEEYEAAQQLFLDLCDVEMLVIEENKVKAELRRKREEERAEAAKPAAQRKKEAKRKKDAEEKAAREKAKQGASAAADQSKTKEEEEQEEEDPVLVLQKQKASKLGAEARFVLAMETSILLLCQDHKDRAKVLIDHGDATLSLLDCADPFVHASLYRAKAQFFKRVGPAEEFFRNALRMSAYTPPDALSRTEQVTFAKELSLSAITGEGIYNFGEVVALPVFESLAQQEDCAWLMKLMLAFKSGEMAQFKQVCTQYAADLEREPILRNNSEVLKEKMALLCLMQLIFLQKPEARTVSFADAAAATHLPLDQVETLIMRAMSVGLIKGSIDEVDQLVRVSWLKPRVLDRSQIVELGKRFSSWRTTVMDASRLVKDNAADVFA